MRRKNKRKKVKEEEKEEKPPKEYNISIFPIKNSFTKNQGVYNSILETIECLKFSISGRLTYKYEKITTLSVFYASNIKL